MPKLAERQRARAERQRARAERQRAEDARAERERAEDARAERRRESGRRRAAARQRRAEAKAAEPEEKKEKKKEKKEKRRGKRGDSISTKEILLSYEVARAECPWRSRRARRARARARACLAELPDPLDDAVDPDTCTTRSAEDVPLVDEAINKQLPYDADDVIVLLRDALGDLSDVRVDERRARTLLCRNARLRLRTPAPHVLLADDPIVLLRDALGDRSDLRVDERRARTLLWRDARVGRVKIRTPRPPPRPWAGRPRGRASEFPGAV